MAKALYRRYRPKSLSEVIGQEHITDTLEKSLVSAKTSHAYLFVGPRGTGKTSVARILAHQINDFPYELEDQHLDIIEIDAASNTGVDNIRSLRENAVIAPTRGKYKVYIIDEVHMLSKSAFNALLKTLEEPPSHVVFIMATTDAHKVPITITSRSQTHVFKLATPATMATHLARIAKAENINIADDALQVIAKRGGGSFRDSISLLDQISTSVTGEITCACTYDAFGLPSDELISQLLAAHLAGDSTCARNSLQTLLDQGIKPETIAEDIISHVIIDPKPELLPLLEALIEVSSSPRPEVKLLLALLNQPAPHGCKTEQTGALQQDSTEHIISPVKKSDLPSSDKLSERSESLDELDAKKTFLPARANDRSGNLAAELPSIHTWQDLLATVKRDNPAFHSLLSRATGQFDGNTLQISVKNKMVRSKIDQKRGYLTSLLPENTTVEITDQSPATTDPLINNLSSIFGNVEEVKLEHDHE